MYSKVHNVKEKNSKMEWQTEYKRNRFYGKVELTKKVYERMREL